MTQRRRSMKIKVWAIIATGIPHAARLQRESYDQKVDWGFAVKKRRWFSMAAGGRADDDSFYVVGRS